MDLPLTADERVDGGADGIDDLMIVSNRQPYRHDYDDRGEVTVDRPTGGLTAGLDPVMRQTDGTWIAWGDGEADREVTDDRARVRVPPEEDAYTLKRLWLTEEDVENYYYGYSNRVLWPLCHGLTGRMEPADSYRDAYRRVNKQFADAVVEEANDDSLVWFQDYHFALAPRAVRDRLPAATMFQFWHIPWPAWETFRSSPDAEALLDGLLANDLLGFHVERYCRHFLDCVDEAVDGATVDRDRNLVEYGGETTRVRAFPLGIDADEVSRIASADDGGFVREFRRRHDIGDDTTLAIGVDRLDYTKGIPQRLEALERFFEEHPGRRGELTFVQKGSLSRSGIPEYRALQNEVVDAVDRINRRFGTDDWQPVVLTAETLDREDLLALYRASKFALVSPIRDGMNLVAKEYVAAQSENGGTLLLSELTGAHDEFGEYALSINPHDVAGMADAIVRALDMSDGERAERMYRMRQRVMAYDLDAWMDDIFRTVRRIQRDEDPTEPSKSVIR